MSLPSGIRTEAKQGSATSSDFQSLVSVPEADDTNAFARVVRERRNHEARDFDAEGEALGALRVRLGLEFPTSQSARVGLREVEFPGPDDEEGGWQAPLRLWSGSYTLHAAADHPSGPFTANSQSTFVIERRMPEVVTTHDEKGNVISCIWRDISPAPLHEQRAARRQNHVRALRKLDLYYSMDDVKLLQSIPHLFLTWHDFKAASITPGKSRQQCRFNRFL